MTMAGDDAPVTPANGEPTIVKQSMMRAWQFGYATAIGVAAGFQCRKTLFSQTVTAEKIHHVGHAVARHLMPHGQGGAIFTRGHVDLRFVARGQPDGLAEMVRVKMSDHNPAHAPPLGRQDVRPTGARGVVAEAGVDQREVLPVVEQPQVDVVERVEREWHTHPRYTVRNAHRLTRSGNVGKGIFDRGMLHGSSPERRRPAWAGDCGAVKDGNGETRETAAAIQAQPPMVTAMVGNGSKWHTVRMWMRCVDQDRFIAAHPASG